MSDDVTRVNSSELDRLEDRTDWERLETLSDEEIRAAVEDDPDQVMLDEEWFERARLVAPSSEKKRITIRLDEDIVEFFKREGKGYQSRINDVLKAYVLSRELNEKDQ